MKRESSFMEITDASFIPANGKHGPGKNRASELLVSDPQPSPCSHIHLGKPHSRGMGNGALAGHRTHARSCGVRGESEALQDVGEGCGNRGGGWRRMES